MERFSKILPEDLDTNFFTLIGKEWFLLTASADVVNPMTASWGMAGVLWNTNCMTVMVRPQRKTFELMETSDSFTLSFFPEAYRYILKFCGSNSGKDVDKIQGTGLDPVRTESGSWLYVQCSLGIECRKVFSQSLDPSGFYDLSVAGEFYPNKDYHRMYIGEITAVYRSRINQ